MLCGQFSVKGVPSCQYITNLGLFQREKHADPPHCLPPPSFHLNWLPALQKTTFFVWFIMFKERDSHAIPSMLKEETAFHSIHRSVSPMSSYCKGSAKVTLAWVLRCVYGSHARRRAACALIYEVLRSPVVGGHQGFGHQRGAEPALKSTGL